jgi:4-hydroxybenzoate polyprenyltransferase
VGVYWLAGWGTWLVYVLDSRGGHSDEDRINRPKRTAFFETHGWTLAVALVLTLIPAAWLLRDVRWTPSAEVLLGLLGLVGIAYVVALLPTRRGLRTLKRTGAVKSVIVTLAWAVGGVGVPLVLGQPTGEGPAGPLWGVAAWGTLVLFLDTLLLDHRDRSGDARNGVQTAATLLGRWTVPVLEGGNRARGSPSADDHSR